MKKLLTMLLALTLVAALCVPAFAARDEEPVFGTSFHLVDNEPTVEHDEWDIPYNVWNALPDNTPLHDGDTVTMELEYTVPATVEGYDERLTHSIEYVTALEGITDAELVEAQGCPGKVECDYEIGICYPVPGEYANVEFENNVLTVMAELGSSVHIVIRGTMVGNEINGSTTVTIGQYHFPAQFSLGTVDKLGSGEAPCYNVHWSDFFLVQKRAVEFHTEDGVMYEVYVALNNHYSHMIPGDHEIQDFVPVDESWQETSDPIAHDDPMFDTLTDIYEQVKDFFGLCYNQVSFGDADFLGEAEHYTFEYPFTFGGEETTPTDEPTEEPVEPTEAPVDPTEAPAPSDPTPVPDPDVPPTGFMSLAIVGAAAAVGGAAIIASRKKED